MWLSSPTTAPEQLWHHTCKLMLSQCEAHSPKRCNRNEDIQTDDSVSVIIHIDVHELLGGSHALPEHLPGEGSLAAQAAPL